MMARLLVCLLTLGMFLCVDASTASAQRLRRPYAPAIAFTYGFDNQGGGGCKDWNCGTICYDGHTGTDHPVGLGTDVVAGAAGRVSAVNNGCANYGAVGNTCGGRCGNYVQISHDDGTIAIYCHMKLSSLTVSTNQRVSCGQKIGQSASSGSSSGPHLHLGWRHGGVSKDSFRGGCTSSPGCWNQQNGYRDPVGTACVSSCQPSTEVCDGKDNDCDGQVDEGVKNACGGCGAVPTEVCDGKDNDCDGQIDEGDLCEVEWLNSEPGAYASARTTDIDGDGRADVCARGGSGLWCHLANGQGFTLDPRSQVVPMASADEWKEAQHYATIRMGDVDGDGLADVCARGAGGVKCWASGGDGSWAEFDGPALSNASGWSAPMHYTTLRLADINGDGRDDLCARAARGLLCWPSTGRGFGEAIDGPLWSNDNGFGAARYYGTLRFGDINGDGKDDACIRYNGAYICAPSNGAGFDEPIQVAEWSDASGWGELRYWASIRLADINGDGKADVCARSSADLRCMISRGDSFGDALIVAPLANAQGWGDTSNWSTLRVADINDDGREDLCIRSDAGMRCWAWDGGQFVPTGGPSWTDEKGWVEESKFATIRAADVDGDGLDDLCTRSHGGLVCNPSLGTGFGIDEWHLDEFKTESGWGDVQHWSTIQIGGPRCSPERCNGRDDDCDGLPDDDTVEAGQPCQAEGAGPCDYGLTACVDGQVICEPMRADTPVCNDTDMVIGSDLGGSGGGDMSGADMGVGGSSVNGTGELGCACGVAPRPRMPGAGWLWLLAGLCLARRRR